MHSLKIWWEESSWPPSKQWTVNYRPTSTQEQDRNWLVLTKSSAMELGDAWISYSKDWANYASSRHPPNTKMRIIDDIQYVLLVIKNNYNLWKYVESLSFRSKIRSVFLGRHNFDLCQHYNSIWYRALQQRLLSLTQLLSGKGRFSLLCSHCMDSCLLSRKPDWLRNSYWLESCYSAAFLAITHYLLFLREVVEDILFNRD